MPTETLAEGASRVGWEEEGPQLATGAQGCMQTEEGALLVGWEEGQPAAGARV
jgi:hypothetical protein